MNKDLAASVRARLLNIAKAQAAQLLRMRDRELQGGAATGGSAQKVAAINFELRQQSIDKRR